MAVTVVSSFTVIPSESTPKGTLWLSENDQIKPWTHTPSIYIYKPQPQHDQSGIIPNAIERMGDSLSKILVPYYPLAGRLCWIGGDRMEVDCNALGVTLIEAQSTKTLDDYGDFEPNETITELIPKVDYSTPIEELPLLLVQLTRFKCGGLSIGMGFNHVIADGVSAIHFINSWAKLARGESLEKDEMPFLDRTVYKSREPLSVPRFEHKEFKPLPLILGYSDSKEEQKKETIVALLKLSREQVEKLRKTANEVVLEEQNLVQKRRPYTRYESMAAHIWRSASKARHNDHYQPTVALFGGSTRNRLNPPLPRNYFGNAVLKTVTPTCLSGDIISKPLSHAAQNVREAIEILTDEYLRSELDFLTSQEKVWLRSDFHTLGCMKAPFSGNPNISIVSWTSMSVYGADFGWGKPEYMGPGFLNVDGKTFILPSPAGDGSFIVVIRLQTAHMEAFKNFFYKDI